MPLRLIQYDGPFDLPLPPPGQAENDQVTSLAQLVIFEFPPSSLDCFEIYTFVELQWTLREALLNGVHNKLADARKPEDVHPEHLPIAAGILEWLAGFEKWLRMLFLYGVFEAFEEAHDRAKAEGDFDRAFLLGMFALLYDKAFDALREFLTNVHYTHYLEDEPTALPITDWQVYVASSDLVISAASDQECLVRKREDVDKPTWWDHRRLILKGGPDQREGVSWLWQEKSEMDELAHRYPAAAMLTRRSFMMPAVQFR
jgi:hypothetical protein